MTALDVIKLARERGVDMKPEGDSLRVKGPKSAVRELEGELKAHKPEIIDALRNDSASSVAETLRSPWPHDHACGCESLAQHFEAGGSYSAWLGRHPLEMLNQVAAVASAATIVRDGRA